MGCESTKIDRNNQAHQFAYKRGTNGKNILKHTNCEQNIKNINKTSKNEQFNSKLYSNKQVNNQQDSSYQAHKMSINQRKLQQNKKNLKIMSLNYSNMHQSPFEFYSNQQQKDLILLNQIFQNLLKEKLKQELEGQIFDIQDINKQFKYSLLHQVKGQSIFSLSNSYSPLYNKKVGIKKCQLIPTQNCILEQKDQQCDFFNFQIFKEYKESIQTENNKQNEKLKDKQSIKRLETYEEFKNQCRKNYQMQIKIKQQHQGQIKQIQEQQTKINKILQQIIKFDLVCYKAILQHVYKSQFNLRKIKIKNQPKKLGSSGQSQSQFIKTLNCQKYQNFMQTSFSKSFIDQQKKIIVTVQTIKNIQPNILFIQKTTSKLRLSLKQNLKSQYYVQQHNQSNSIILLKKESIFGQKVIQSSVIKNKIITLNQISWNCDTLGIVVNNYILICTNLSENEEQNIKQKEKLLIDLYKLSQTYQGFIIIMAGIMKTLLDNTENYFYCFPEDPQMITSTKKKTSMQTDIKQANKIVQGSHVQIISNVSLLNRNIWTADREMPDPYYYLPNQQYPYDDYLLYAEIYHRPN